MGDEDEGTEFDRAWEQTEYVAVAPSDNIRVTMIGDRDIRVWVDPSWFARARCEDAERQLAQVAKLLYVARTRAYYDTSSAVAGMEISPVTDYVSDEQRRYFEGLEQLHSQGSSADGGVTVTMVGRSHFAVSVDLGPAAGNAGAFQEACREAAMACFVDHTEGWQRLHFDIYTRPKMERAGLL